MSETQKTAQEKLAESTKAAPTSTAAQQSDNVAHALAGAGGGLLSMALTYVLIWEYRKGRIADKKIDIPSSPSPPAPKSNRNERNPRPSTPPDASSSGKALQGYTPASTPRSSESALRTLYTTTVSSPAMQPWKGRGC